METTVRLVARAEVAYGEDMLLCGSAPALGSWKADAAATMTWEDGAWAAEVLLPCGVRVELKVVVRSQGGILRWYGIGQSPESNVVLETSLGRGGARGSRFVSDCPLPFDLEVSDVEVEPGAQGIRREVPPAASAPQPPQGAELALAGAGYAPGAPMPMGMPWMMSPQQQEVAAAAMLAGAAGAAGHAVTYTTTTTTTTAVTINGHAGDPRMACAPGQPMILGPAVGGSPVCGHGGGRGGGGGVPTPSGRCALPGPGSPQSGGSGGTAAGKAEVTPEQRQAYVAAQAKNTGIPRFGPVALQWPPPANGEAEPKQVLARGSWDGWARDLALQPSPGGGWRLLMVLPPGEYEFKFIVDGVWTTSDEMDLTACDNRNNVVVASDMALAPTIPLALPAPSTVMEVAAGAIVAVAA